MPIGTKVGDAYIEVHPELERNAAVTLERQLQTALGNAANRLGVDLGKNVSRASQQMLDDVSKNLKLDLSSNITKELSKVKSEVKAAGAINVEAELKIDNNRFKQAARTAAGDFVNEFSRFATSLPTDALVRPLSTPIGAALGIAIASQIPVAIGAAGGAIIAAIGAIGIGAGIASQLKDPAIMAAAEGLGEHVKSTFEIAGRAFEEPMLRSIQIIRQAWDSILPSLKGTFDTLATSLEPIVLQVTEGIKTLAPALERAAMASKPLLESLAAIANIFMTDLAPAIDRLSEAMPGLGPIIEKIVAMLAEMIVSFVNLAAAVGEFSQGFADALIKVSTLFADFFDKIANLPAPIRALLGPIGDFASQASAAFRDLANDTQVTMDRFKNLESAGVNPLKSSFGDLKGIIDTAKDSVLNLDNAFDLFLKGAQDADKANLQIDRNLRALTETIKTNGTELKGNSTAATENRIKVRELAESLVAEAQARLKAGESAASVAKHYQSQLQFARERLEQMGFEKAEIDKLVGGYEKFAKDWIAKASVEGAAESQAQIDGIIKKFDEMQKPKPPAQVPSVKPGVDENIKEMQRQVPAWVETWNQLKAAAEKAWGEISQALASLPLFDVSKITVDWQGLWDDLKGIAAKAWDEITKLFNFENLLSAGGGVADKLREGFNSIFGGAASGGSVGKSVLGQFAEQFGGADAQAILQGLQTLVDQGKLKLDELVTHIGGPFVTAISTNLSTATQAVSKFGTDLAPVMDAAKLVFDGLTTHLNSIFKPAWDAFFLALQTPITAFKTFMDTMFGPGMAFQLLFDGFLNYLNTIFKVGWDTFLSNWMLSFDTFKLAFQTGWQSILDFLNVVVLVNFQTFAANIKLVWDGILAQFNVFKDTLIAALNTMVDGALSAINKLISILDSAIDKVNKVLPKDLKIAKIGQISGGAGGRPAAGRQGFATGGVVGYANGGKVSGLGSRTSDSIPAWLSNGEVVVRAEAAKQFGYGALMHINKYGTLPDGPGPGAPKFSAGAIIAAAKTSGIPHIVGSTFRSAPQPGMSWDHHMGGNAVDFPGFNQDAFATWWLQRASALLELIHLSGGKAYAVKNGGPYAYDAATMAAHANHVHVASSHGSATDILSGFPVGGAMAGPGMGNGVAWMGMLAEEALRSILDKQWKPALPKPDGLGLTGTLGIFAKAAEGMIDWIISTLPISIPLGGSGAGGAVGASKWAGLVTSVLQEMGQPTSLASYVLKSIEQESGGNPNAVQHGYVDVNTATGDLAKGLNQVIGATFNAAVKGTPYEGKSQFDPRANIYASIRYAMNRYGANWYERMAAPGGYDQGGILNPGEVGMNAGTRPEMVLNPAQGQALLRNIENADPGGGTSDITVICYIDGVQAQIRAEVIKNNRELANAIERGRNF